MKFIINMKQYICIQRMLRSPNLVQKRKRKKNYLNYKPNILLKMITCFIKQHNNL